MSLWMIALVVIAWAALIAGILQATQDLCDRLHIETAPKIETFAASIRRWGYVGQRMGRK